MNKLIANIKNVIIKLAKKMSLKEAICKVASALVKYIKNTSKVALLAELAGLTTTGISIVFLIKTIKNMTKANKIVKNSPAKKNNVKLDEEDYVKDAYILEVSSPGLGRKLSRERHFIQSMGEEIEIKTYKPIDNSKEFVGILKGYNNGDVTIETEDGDRTFVKDDIAGVRLTIDF